MSGLFPSGGGDAGAAVTSGGPGTLVVSAAFAVSDTLAVPVTVPETFASPDTSVPLTVVVSFFSVTSETSVSDTDVSPVSSACSAVVTALFSSAA